MAMYRKTVVASRIPRYLSLGADGVEENENATVEMLKFY